MSPYADLTLAGATMDTKRAADPLLSRESLQSRVPDYTAGQDPALGLISPVTSPPGCLTSSRPFTPSSTKRPPPWTEPDSSSQRTSPAPNPSPLSKRQSAGFSHSSEAAGSIPPLLPSPGTTDRVFRSRTDQRGELWRIPHEGGRMARVLITGSSDGLGLMAARLLVDDGHAVILHARNEQRGDHAQQALPGAEHVVIGDLESIAGMRQVAEQANARGRYDAVIHNAGIGYREPRRIETVDGLCHVFAVNVIAPYVLTALVPAPDRLVYLSSGMHRGGQPDLDDLQWARRSWNGAQAYSDSKLFDVVLAFGVARRWPTRVVQCPRTRLGPYQDGRPRRARRPEPGARHPGLAGRERRPRRHRDRRLLLSPTAPGGAPGRPLGRCPRRVAGALQTADRHPATAVVGAVKLAVRQRCPAQAGHRDRSGDRAHPS